MTGHSSHFKVVHNKHASSSSSSSSKRRLPSSSDITSRESDDILDVEVNAGPLINAELEIENDGSVEVEVKVGGVEADVEVTPRAAVLKKRADSTPSEACDTGGFYTAPTIGSTHDSLQPLTVSWDPSLNCLSGTLVDIYLYAPHSTSPRIHLWSRVKAARGKMDVEIMPRWWNATSSEELQIQIVESGKPPFLSNLPAGPVFTATYAPPSDGSTPTVADTSVVDIGETRVNDDVKASSTSKGKIAAGILVPLLFLAIGALFFLRWKRARSLADRKKWTEAVDKRMSTISTDWKSVTGKGAQEAIRKSFAAGNRASTFSFNNGPNGGGRPSSQWANDEWNNEKGDVDGDLGAQKRPGVGLRNPASLSGAGERVSRVSFADGPRPSSESRRTKVMRDSYVPPVPSLPTVATASEYTSSSGYGAERDGSEEGTGSGAMSPTQTQGAFSLTPEAIRARIAAGRARSGSGASAGAGGAGQVKPVGSVDIGGEETLAALSMMRTGAAGASTDDLLFAAPAAPPQAYSSPLAGSSVVASPIASSYNTTAPLNLHGQSYSSNGMSSPTVSSPVMSSIPMPAMQAMPAAMMSPDDMLRAYAERKKSMSAVPASHGSSSSLSSSAYNTSSSSAYAPSGYGNVNGVAYPAMPAPAAGGRTLFNGSTVSPQHSGEKKERTPSLGFAPGEYDPNFTFQQEEDAYGGMDGNAAGRGAWRS